MVDFSCINALRTRTSNAVMSLAEKDLEEVAFTTRPSPFIMFRTHLTRPALLGKLPSHPPRTFCLDSDCSPYSRHLPGLATEVGAIKDVLIQRQRHHFARRALIHGLSRTWKRWRIWLSLQLRPVLKIIRRPSPSDYVSVRSTHPLALHVGLTLADAINFLPSSNRETS